MNKRSFSAFCIIFFVLSLIFAKPKQDLPLWYDSVTIEEVFPNSKFIARTGFGASAEEAAAFAQADISSYFSQTVVSHTEATSKMTQSGKTSEESRSIERQVVIDSAMQLFAIHKTTPYYDKKTKKYAVCVYLDREEAFSIYEGTLIRLQKKFLSTYNTAEKETDAFKKIIRYSQCVSPAEKYSDSLDFARILYIRGAEKYSDDYDRISSIENKIISAKKSVQLNVKVINDSSNKIRNCVKDILSNDGYFISDNESKIMHIVSVNINLNKHVSGESILSEPSVSINITNAQENIFAYSKNIQKISGFTEAESFLERKAYQSIEQEIQKSFLKEFHAFLTSGL